MTNDGTGILLGKNADRVNFWEMPIPPARRAVPEWFPDFLDSFAMLCADSSGGFEQLSVKESRRTIEKVAELSGMIGLPDGRM